MSDHGHVYVREIGRTPTTHARCVTCRRRERLENLVPQPNREETR